MHLTRSILFLFLLTAFAGIAFADISEVGSFRSPTDVYDVEVDGDYAYVPDYNNGLYVVNVSDPSNPAQTGHVENEDYYYRAIAKQGDYIYTAEYNNGLGIYNISDPANPTRVGNVQPAPYFYDVEVEGDYVYALSFYYGLYIFDISDPEDPYVISNIRTEGFNYGLAVDDGIICIASYYYGMVVVDATDPANPEIQSSLTGYRYMFAYGVDIQDGIAYLVDQRNGMMVIDISDAANPNELGSIADLSNNYNVTVEGDFAFLASNIFGMRVIDVSDPTNPTLSETYDTQGAVWNTRIKGSFAFVADYDYYMRILDVSAYTSQPEIVADQDAIDFGVVEFRRFSSQVLTISNVGGSDLTISDITLSGNYYVIDFSEEFVLATDETQELNISIIPEEVAELPCEIVVFSNDPEYPELTISLATNCVWVPAPELLERLSDVCYDLDLNRGQRKSLASKLNNIIRKFNRGQLRPGRNQLNAFMNHVADFVEDGVLSAEDGSALITEGQFIMDLVNDFGVDSHGDALNLVKPGPDDFYFENCYPNPFNAETTISFGLPEASFVSIKVYDMAGRVVSDLANTQYNSARYEISWRAQDIPAGNYLIHLNAGEFNSIRKVALIK